MNYTEFKDALVSSVKEHLDASIRVELRNVTKNNGVSLDAIVIVSDTSNVSPTLYINHLYGAYQNGESLSSIACHLIELNARYKPKTNFDISLITDFEKAKSNLIYKLINFDKNRDLLKNVPHIAFLDLAIVFYYQVPDIHYHDGFILITNDMLTTWGKTKEDVFSISKENTKRLYKISVTKVYDLVCNRLSPEEQAVFEIENIPLYILTNIANFNGANCLLDTDTLSSLSDMHESNLFIIPSSIHETLFIPEDENPMDIEYMVDMVKYVNQTELTEQDILSDHIYYFDRLEKKLSIAG
ncbi:MAG: DUF5688 family protein [Lachnospiraceae bacterium]|nr:DUF5688 family protein [Lachnospiraceae bacterium]